MNHFPGAAGKYIDYLGSLIFSNCKSLQNVIKTTTFLEKEILTLKDRIKDILDMSSKQKTDDTIEYLKKLIDN